jgi:DNA-binding transcriptional regulator YiaG
MNEKEIIQQALKDKAALDTGNLTPGRVQKVVKKANGKAELIDVPTAVVKAATRLRKLRNKATLTQESFAKLLGLPLSTYRNYEQYVTETPPPVLKLASIAATHPELVSAA